jgi:predicted HAD superfamily Cof-like phosphohydrolase
MQLNFAECQMTWLGAAVPFHPKGYFCDQTKLHQLLEHDSVQATIAETCSASQAHVKDVVYNDHDPAKVAADQVHLTEEQRDDLAAVFS